MKVITGDTVLVTTGKDKGKQARVVRALPKKSKVVVEGVNMVTKHIKKQGNRPGQRIQFEKPIDASNVKVVSPISGKPTRIGYKRLENGKKVRIDKKTGEQVPNAKLAAK